MRYYAGLLEPLVHYGHSCNTLQRKANSSVESSYALAAVNVGECECRRVLLVNEAVFYSLQSNEHRCM